MLNADLKQQLQQLLELMEGDVEFVASLGSDDKSKELKELLDEVTEMSSHITLTEKELKRTPSFSVNRPGEETGITFAGIPLGHEFNSKNHHQQKHNTKLKNHKLKPTKIK